MLKKLNIVSKIYFLYLLECKYIIYIKVKSEKVMIPHKYSVLKIKIGDEKEEFDCLFIKLSGVKNRFISDFSSRPMHNP